MSSLGQVRRIATGRILKQTRDPGGYFAVSLSVSGCATTRSVHVLVAEAFHGPRPVGNWVDHISGVKADNSAANLEYTTPSENCQRAWDKLPRWGSKLRAQKRQEARAAARAVAL